MNVICFIIVLGTATICNIAMKKMEPGNKWFPFYTLGIVMLVAWAFTKTTS